jgi:hypothetical protein
VTSIQYCMQILIASNRPYYLHTNVGVLCHRRKRVCWHVLPITAVFSRGEARVKYGHSMLHKFQDKLIRVDVWRDQTVSNSCTTVECRLINYEQETMIVRSNRFNRLISNCLLLSSTEDSVRKYEDLIRFTHYGYNETSGSKYYIRVQ